MHSDGQASRPTCSERTQAAVHNSARLVSGPIAVIPACRTVSIALQQGSTLSTSLHRAAAAPWQWRDRQTFDICLPFSAAAMYSRKTAGAAASW